MRTTYWVFTLVFITASALPADDPSTSGTNPCNTFFGHPTQADCAEAIEQLNADDPEPEYQDLNTLRYLRPPTNPERPGIYNQEVPMVSVAGDCVVLIAFEADLVANHPASELWDTTTWEDLRSVGRTINERCVGVPGILSGGQLGAGQNHKLMVQVLGPGSQVDDTYQQIMAGAIIQEAWDEGEGVQKGTPLGDNPALFEARVCKETMDCDAKYADDCIKFQSAVMSLVMYGLSTLESLSVCN